MKVVATAVRFCGSYQIDLPLSTRSDLPSRCQCPTTKAFLTHMMHDTDSHVAEPIAVIASLVVAK